MGCLSFDLGPRRPLQFQGLGPLLTCGRSVSSLVAPKHTKHRSFCPNRVLRALVSFPLTSSAVSRVSPHDYGRIRFCPFSWECTRTSHVRFYRLSLLKVQELKTSVCREAARATPPGHYHTEGLSPHCRADAPTHRYLFLFITKIFSCCLIWNSF